ncbi:MAG: hypothetical protein Q4A17_15310 [Thermoguttaceae bacterium]|nr:hypothetical protein [Thermoguttaceae bacterium]
MLRFNDYKKFASQNIFTFFSENLRKKGYFDFRVNEDISLGGILTVLELVSKQLRENG